ncbi:MAG: RrF2 family transcriptional regulator [Planctomycetota bacterium]|jgi:Rrf2 family protein
MYLSQKCQYSLRALFELAKRHGQGPIRIADVAEAQAIPPRFLELILGELKQAGYVESRRGAAGGYLLAVHPNHLAVGDIIRFVEGPLAPVKCLVDPSGSECPLNGHCAFMGLWDRAAKALADVYDSASLQELIENERTNNSVADYCI